jgi:hypothetical protein
MLEFGRGAFVGVLIIILLNICGRFTTSITGNTVALLHAFASNLSFEWLEGIHSVVNNQRPITCVAQLRLAFRIIGPLLPRLVVSKPLFSKVNGFSKYCHLAFVLLSNYF